MANLIRDRLQTEGLNHQGSSNEVILSRRDGGMGVEVQPGRLVHRLPAVQRAAHTSCLDPHGGAAALRTQPRLRVLTARAAE